MKKITFEMLRNSVVYDKETGCFSLAKGIKNKKAGDFVGSKNSIQGYIELSICGIKAYGHRMAWLYEYGAEAEGSIDHINGIRHDNRIANLRLASSFVNAQNTRKPSRNNTSGFLGVSFCPQTNRWVAQITAGKHINLGRYDTPEHAYEVYLAAKRRLHSGCTI